MPHVRQLKAQLIDFCPNPSPKSPPRTGEGTYTPVFDKAVSSSPSWRGGQGAFRGRFFVDDEKKEAYRAENRILLVGDCGW